MKNFTSKALLKKLGGLAVCLSISSSVFAQEVLTLEQSIEMARQNNVSLRQARYSSNKADIILRKTKLSYLPTLSAETNVRRVNGLTFDNVSGQLKRGNTNTSSPYMVGQLVLFDGFSKLYELKRAKQQSEANKYGQVQADIDMEALITGYYLQAVLDRENMQIAHERISLLEQQISKMETLERAGVRTQDDVYQLKAQLATEKLNLITHKNNYRQSTAALVQEMNVQGSTDYELQVPQTPIDITAELPALDAVLERAIGYSPQLKAAEASVQVSRYSHSIARSSLSPTLSLRGIVGSNYSSNYRVLNPENGDFSRVPYFDQVDQNQQKIVELSLSIPVFNGFSRHFEAQAARMDLRNAELDLNAAQNSLKQTIQQAYLDVLAAQEKYNTVMANLEYTEKAFVSAKRRYEAGTTDFFSYLESLNNKNKAQTELLQSKCEFYFKLRILELYQG
ncbi:TolC family protein [Pontibacter sp. MBLB2868]|uniref:TolC family protein n=1 Tax=Pontibacter sp. MBLB2868 TaxID=3451555 RepID=UPI003F754E64